MSGIIETPGGSVTAASIDTALQSATAAQDRSIRESLALRQTDRLNTQRYTAAKVRAWGASIGTAQSDPVRVMIAGDSLSTGIEPTVNMGVTGFVSQSTFLTAGSAPIVLESDDWINGRVIQIPVGTTVQFHQTGGVDAAYVCSKISIGWIAEPGAGSFQVQTSTPQRSSGAWENVGSAQSTENATKIGRWVDLDVPSTSTAPAYKVRITNVTTKPLKLICWGVWNHLSWGVTWMSGVANMTGRDIPSWANCPDAIFNPIFQGLRPDLVLSRWADAGSDWQSGGAWRTQYSRMKALDPECDFVQLSGGPVYGGVDSGVTWPTYYSAQSQYRVGDVAVAQNDTTKIWGRYVCKQAHTQQADRKPGQGASWTTFWDPFVYDPAITASSDAAFAAQAAAQEQWAEEFGESFLDLRDVFGPYQQAFATGLIGDFVHPTTTGWEMIAASLNRRMAAAYLPLGGIGVYGGNFQFSQMPGESRVLLDRPLEIGHNLAGGLPLVRIRASDAGQDSRKGLTLFAQNSRGYMTVDGTSIFELALSANGAGQHALVPMNSAFSVGIPSARCRVWLGGISAGTRTVTGATTLAAATDHTVYCNAASGAFAITFPAANTCAGHLFVIKKIDASANAITLSTTIDGVPNPALTSQWQTARIRSDGAAYYYE